MAPVLFRPVAARGVVTSSPERVLLGLHDETLPRLAGCEDGVREGVGHGTTSLAVGGAGGGQKDGGVVLGVRTMLGQAIGIPGGVL